MSKKTTFSRLAQIREYAELRAGGDKPFSRKDAEGKAWTNVLTMVNNFESNALASILNNLEAFVGNESVSTKARIYAFVAERIEHDG